MRNRLLRLTIPASLLMHVAFGGKWKENQFLASKQGVVKCVTCQEEAAVITRPHQTPFISRSVSKSVKPKTLLYTCTYIFLGRRLRAAKPVKKEKIFFPECFVRQRENCGGAKYPTLSYFPAGPASYTSTSTFILHVWMVGRSVGRVRGFGWS